MRWVSRRRMSSSSSPGMCFPISEEKAAVVGRVPAQGILVDGLGVGDVGNIVLRDRQHLSQNGLFIVVVTLDRYNNMLLAGPGTSSPEDLFT